MTKTYCNLCDLPFPILSPRTIINSIYKQKTNFSKKKKILTSFSRMFNRKQDIGIFFFFTNFHNLKAQDNFCHLASYVMNYLIRFAVSNVFVVVPQVWQMLCLHSQGGSLCVCEHVFYW